MADTRDRTLHYRRAFFLVDTVHKPTLAYFVKNVHDMFQTINERRVKLADGSILECRRYGASNDGIQMQIVSYKPGEEMSIVPHEPNRNDMDLSTTPPPKGADFWDGDINVFISENHVIYCASNSNEKDIERYIVGMMQKKGFDDGALLWSLKKTAPLDKVEIIKTQGVKQIKLDSTMYAASIDRIGRKTVRKKIFGSIWREIKEYFSEDESTAELLASENVTAEVVIKFDGRRKGGDLAKEKLEKLAESIVSQGADESSNGFSILTGDNQSIKAADLSLSKPITLIAHGKTVDCSSCWREMSMYFDELKSVGILEV